MSSLPLRGPLLGDVEKHAEMELYNVNTGKGIRMAKCVPSSPVPVSR